MILICYLQYTKAFAKAVVGVKSYWILFAIYLLVFSRTGREAAISFTMIHCHIGLDVWCTKLLEGDIFLKDSLFSVSFIVLLGDTFCLVVKDIAQCSICRRLGSWLLLVEVGPPEEFENIGLTPLKKKCGVFVLPPMSHWKIDQWWFAPTGFQDFSPFLGIRKSAVYLEMKIPFAFTWWHWRLFWLITGTGKLIGWLFDWFIDWFIHSLIICSAGLLSFVVQQCGNGK